MDTRKAAISDISESTYAKVTYFYRVLLVVTLGIPVMPRVNRDLKLYYKCVCFCKQHKSIRLPHPNHTGPKSKIMPSCQGRHLAGGGWGLWTPRFCDSFFSCKS